MKVIKYQVLGYTGVFNPEAEEVEQKECLAGVECAYTEEAYEKALAEAYNGEVTIEEVADVESEPTAQEDTDAMMVDHEYRLTLLELGLTE